MTAFLVFLMMQITPYPPCCTQDVTVDMCCSEGTPADAEWRLVIEGQITRTPILEGLSGTLLVPCGTYRIHTVVKYEHEFSIFRDGFEDGDASWDGPPPLYTDTVVSDEQLCTAPKEEPIHA